MKPDDEQAVKRALGREAASLVQSGNLVGLGSGSTAREAIIAIGERMARGELEGILGVSTSLQAALEAQRVGIPLLDVAQVEALDIAIDGADEVSPGSCVIKGGGGAHVLEKIVASLARKFIVIAGSGKVGDRPGCLAPVPVAVLTQSCSLVPRKLVELGGRPQMRLAGAKLGPVISDQGHVVMDTWFDEIRDAGLLEQQISRIPGVVGNGLFVGLADLILVGDVKEGQPVVYEYSG